ncbi:hypothetical protein [Deinococcus ruber]|uniref:Uncharacterized protein n=1 Tax=Deinococcus ruber TaxID=1848197 RepID=A0A918C1E1_9DEIO|nr:hypothetical protein [Deinococcus ruber]GGQ99851.1 hypothetical protein GCM10008957_10640 [Deinococcus ruber]
MTKKPNPAAKLPTEALLNMVSAAMQRLSALSKDEKVRQEALNVGQAVGRLMQAIRDSSRPPK